MIKMINDKLKDKKFSEVLKLDVDEVDKKKKEKETKKKQKEEEKKDKKSKFTMVLGGWKLFKCKYFAQRKEFE